ncbi:MAG: hypothetical protein KF718_29345 [Polyangiaceae bacterium]|nr:hypothetical protein [Polyangiaceae bacterium]
MYAMSAVCRLCPSARLALSVCAAVLGVLLPKLAWGSVPMCGEDAQSIAAPFPLMPTRGGELRPGCDAATSEFDVGQSRAPDGSVTTPPPHERVLPVSVAWALGRKGDRVPVPVAERARHDEDHRQGVFRPPRS